MIEKIKRRLGIDDDLQDALLSDLIEDAQSQFRIITRQSDIDSKYDFIIVDVVSKMYNRKGSEGMQSETVDGYSVSYVQSLFADYMPILERDFDLDENNHRQKGKVVFF